MRVFIKDFRILFLFLLICFAGCKGKSGSFILLGPSQTGINFNNKITESDSVNIFDFANIYNGGGVAVADFNNDGLQDLYFTGNMVSNQLYLNKGKMSFKDVTASSNTSGNGIWSRGVAAVDINNDGRKDIYVCATAKRDPKERINLLYVNQGNDKDSSPVFKEMAAEYGLADTSQSTMAYFFDYDNDGDLDMYIAVNHIIKDEYANVFRPRNIHGEHPSTGRLYRNDYSDSLHHPFYTNVSAEAGIQIEGYSHSADIFDANNDGWLDILVLNDYVSSNVLYINNHDGTFTDHVKEYFKHGSANSMGSDAVDINNDGMPDVIEVDMAPQDNLRKKMFQAPVSYQTYQNTELFGYQYQYTRNMLQVNMGPTVGENDSIGHPVFGDAGFLAGVAETDWSWTPLVADFDNDGNKDIVFTNGFPKDITDRDFMTYRNQAFQLTSEKEMLGEIPEVKIHNYIYKNHGGLKFSDESANWGLDAPTFSNGAVYADLDNDGDLDMVISNIDDPAMVYENRIFDKSSMPGSLSIKLTGGPQNIDGIGAVIKVYQGDSLQQINNNPFRGYLSSQPTILHVGLGNSKKVDSVRITWTGGLTQLLTNIDLDKQLNLKESDATIKTPALPALASGNWFSNITALSGISYQHNQRDFVDFNIQKLLPHKFSEYTPGITVGDINGDGLDDFITGGVTGFSAMIFTQRPDGRFDSSALLSKENIAIKQSEDRGLLLFDADNDHDLDLYISSGGYQYDSGVAAYADQLFINDGKGKFTPADHVLPGNNSSKFCVRACDYDKDGDLDLFIAGRVDPHAYPRPVSSFIYRNDSKDGAIRFTDVTQSIAPALQNVGLTCDAVFSDYDNDGWPDLVLSGEWMPIRFFHNDKGKFADATAGSGIQQNTGWWNSLFPGDFDNDGDIDFVAGNLGLNSFFRAFPGRPVNVYAKDFDDNGSYDAIPSLYLPDDLTKNASWHEYPAFGRDDMIKQILGIRRDFQTYKVFAQADMQKILPPEKMKGVLKLSANVLTSSYIRNDGNGHFSIAPLPLMAQFSVLNGMVADDFNGDGNTDIIFSTNDYGTDPNNGRYDALNGLVLAGDGKGNFKPLSILESGIFINGNGKGMAKILAGNNYAIVSTQNKGPVQLFKCKNEIKTLRAEPGDSYAVVTLLNGGKQKQELNYGASFLSQGSRFFVIPKQAQSITITDGSGRSRQVSLK